ncbi:MAG: hypothetical protein GJV46_12880 [Geobacter sp.]|nr:hypothetical protein [Geobacter sp.]
MEKRYFTRVECMEGASITHDNNHFSGDIQNICLQGLFIKTKQAIPLNSSLRVTVNFSPNDPIHFYADVVRREESGVGVKIKGMDVNSFVQLRNLVARQCNDHGRIMRETYKVTNCIQ